MPLYKFQYRCRSCTIVFYPRGIHAGGEEVPLMLLSEAIHPPMYGKTHQNTPPMQTVHNCGTGCCGVADLIGFEPVP